MPAWTQTQLIEQGRLTTDRITETTQTRTCPTCGQPVLAALADTFRTIVDPTPLSPQGELAALLAGRDTYRHGGRMLTMRLAAQIQTWPAGTSGETLARHRCGASPLSRAPKTFTAPPPKDTNKCPPF